MSPASEDLNTVHKISFTNVSLKEAYVIFALQLSQEIIQRANVMVKYEYGYTVSSGATVRTGGGVRLYVKDFLIYATLLRSSKDVVKVFVLKTASHNLIIFLMYKPAEIRRQELTEKRMKVETRAGILGNPTPNNFLRRLQSIISEVENDKKHCGC